MPEPPPKKAAGGGDWASGLREAGPYLGIGSSMAASVLLGLGAGYWLDGKLGTRPFLFLLGGLLGILAALLPVYRLVGRKR